jgi:iron(III) transport system substrate-binding protein
MRKSLLSVLALVLLAAVGLAAWRYRQDNRPTDTPATKPPGVAGEVVVYSGRSEDLVKPILDRFQAESGLTLKVRYGKTAEMAAMILEEGGNSPADVYFAQDAGALGALSAAGRLVPLPQDLLDQVDSRFRSPRGRWIGLSGRARVMVHHPERAPADTLPQDWLGLTQPAWKGRIGWAPANGSFQAQVTAMRVGLGEAATRAWLEAVRDNGAKSYANNTAILLGIAAGEIDVGLANHYYLHQLQKEKGADFPVRNHLPARGTLINVAGAGVLDTAPNRAGGEALLRFLLGPEAQAHFAGRTFEIPLARGVPVDPQLPARPTIGNEEVDLDRLEDLQGTLNLLREVGLL